MDSTVTISDTSGRSMADCDGSAGIIHGSQALSLHHRNYSLYSSVLSSPASTPLLSHSRGVCGLDFSAGAAQLKPACLKRSSACLSTHGDSLRYTKPRVQDLATNESSPEASPPASNLALSFSPGISSMEDLPDELLSLVLAHAAQGCSCPANFIILLLTCKKFRQLGGQPQVLRRLPSCALRVSAADWCPAALRLLLRSSQAGNVAATYALGMMGFYCLAQPVWGLRMLAQAAATNSPEALFSVSLIHFNGSSRVEEHRDVIAGVLLCIKAAQLGHVDAMRELGHCLQDGYGVVEDALQGRQLLLRANAEETAQALIVAKSASHSWSSASSDDHDCSCSSALLGCCTALRTKPVPQNQSQGVRAASFCHRRSSSAAGHLVGSSTKELPRSLSSPAALDSAGSASAISVGDVDTTSGDYHESTPTLKSECHVAMAREDDCVPLIQSLVSFTEPQGAPEAVAEGTDASDIHHQSDVSLVDSPVVRREVAADVSTCGVGAVLYDHAAAAPCSCCCLPPVMLPLHARVDGWVNEFLVDWHELEDGRGTHKVCAPCSNPLCGRKELRENEFRCCSACTEARYCSRVCQAQDWKSGHKIACALLAQARMNQAAAVQPA